MASLLHDIRRGASPKAERGQQAIEFSQYRDRYPRRAEPQPRTGSRIEHPGRDHSDDPRRHFDMDDLTRRSPLGIVPPQPAAVQRVPAVVNDDLTTDMGRMTPRLS